MYPDIWCVVPRLLAIMPFTSIAMSATMAPRIEIYTVLACSVHKPDIFKQSFPGLELGLVEEPKQLSTHSSVQLIDRVYLPHLTDKLGRAANGSVPTNPNLCASDPVVQAAVAKLTAGAFSDLPTSAYFVTLFSGRAFQARICSICCLE